MTATRFPKYERDYFSVRGEEIFNEHIKSQVEHLDPEWHLLIDIESGEFAVGPNYFEPSDRLIAKNPNAQIYHRMVGHDWTVSFGGRPLKPGEVRVWRVT